MEKNLKIGIVGAGIQGISNALFLQKKGFKVTIFDREEPGSPAASYGNAGHFSLVDCLLWKFDQSRLPCH